MQIGKSKYIESNRTYCCIRKFNIALSLCKVLEVAFYFSKGFLEAVTEVLQLLEVAVICFLKQKSNL